MISESGHFPEASRDDIHCWIFDGGADDIKTGESRLPTIELRRRCLMSATTGSNDARAGDVLVLDALVEEASVPFAEEDSDAMM